MGAGPILPSILSCGDCFVGVSRAALEAMSCRACRLFLPVHRDFSEYLMESEESLNTAMRTNFCFRDMEASLFRQTDKGTY